MGMVVVRAAAVGFLAEHTAASLLKKGLFPAVSGAPRAA
jgi:hypothetical protein